MTPRILAGLRLMYCSVPNITNLDPTPPEQCPVFVAIAIRTSTQELNTEIEIV